MPESHNIYDLNQEQLLQSLQEWGEPAFRSSQLWDGLYRQLWDTPEEFTNLPKVLRQQLSASFTSPQSNPAKFLSFSNLTSVRDLKSNDGESIKTLFSLHDGKQVEAVLMRYSSRRTLCISTQSGCAMGCVFCATGQMGFQRNLSSGEIVEQVLYFARQLKQQDDQVTNVVVMGMGEPFHNYDATLAAILRLNDPQGFNLGARRFTISTVGLVPAIRRFTGEHSQVNLAISLHAADDELRSQLLPVNHKYPIDQLLSACLEYTQLTRRRISFEWALIQGINDTPDQAHKLAERLQIFRAGGANLSHVNVIPLNPTSKYHGLASSHQRAVAFKNFLELANIPCTIRLRRGIEIQAGCGQLARGSN
jgi:23S rRNA (adenine2503-C2)-methyltransferase